MKTTLLTLLLIAVAALAAPLSAQSRGGETMLDPGATIAAYGPTIGADHCHSVVVWNSDDTVFSSNSRDGGRNYTAAPIVIAGGTASGAKRTYKDGMALDHPYIHLVYEDEATGSEEHMYAMSMDMGDTWSTPSIIPSAGSGYITDIEVFTNAHHGGAGTAIVVVSLAMSFPNGCFVNVSNDNGLTWTETRLDPGTGDVDGVDASMDGDNLLVTFNDDSSGTNQTYAVVSNDAGASFGPVVTLSTGGVGKTAFPVCYTEHGDMVVTWLEDDSSLSGTYEDIMASYSTDNGLTWGSTMNLTNNAGAYDCDNLEVTHSQMIAGTGGLTNFVFENNTSGSDEVFCVSTDDRGVTLHTTNFGSGSYPRVAGTDKYVGVAYGSDPTGGYVESPMLAISRDGGLTFRASADVSQGASTGDSDYVELAMDPVYDNYHIVSIENRTGQNQVYVGGSRVALLEPVIDTTAHTAQFNVSGFGIASGSTSVQLYASGSTALGVGMINDDRDTLMDIDQILLVSRSFTPFRVTLDSLGNGSTAAISIPARFYGATLQFAGIELLAGGAFGTLIEPVAVTL